MDVVKQLGKRIRELRTSAHRQKRMTQEDLAELADISVSFLSMIERGERAPHIETLASIAGALEVELHELFTFTGKVEHKHGSISSSAGDEADPAVKALADFARRHSLTKREADKLLGVAKTMFPR